MVGSYYPNYSAVGRCQGNIAEELEKQGYTITVIAEKNKLDEADTEMLGNQKIIRITNNNLSKRLRFSNRKDLHGKAATQYLRVKEAIQKIVSPNSLRRYKMLAYYNALKALDFVPDIIVPTCLPFETVVAAVKYKQELKCCRVVPVIYDMFAENTGLTLTSWNKKMKKRSNLSIESNAFEYCDRILHMPSWTPHISSYHTDILSKTKEVEHPLIKEPNTSCEKIFDDGINLAFTGVVDNVIRNPQSVLDLFLNNEFPNVKIHFYAMGNASGKIEEASKRCSSIEYHGKVDSLYAHNVITEANILVSIGNSVADQFPSKIFEYMSTGKPIIHFYQIEDDPAIAVLKKYPLSLCVQADSIQYENVKAFINENNQKTLDFKTVRDIFSNASPEIISLMVT